MSVCVCCRVVTLVLTRAWQLAWALCDPQQLQSEGGYYLTVLESAVTYLTTPPPLK